MPSTINGIGTTYYGKKNVEKTFTVCRHCGYTGELTSYETRLWFVFIFIPIIPLGKKKIIDFCPKCTMHYPYSLAEWEQIGKESVLKAKSEVSQNPDSPDAAIRAHCDLSMFNERQEAAKLAETMKEKYADNFDVQMYLGAFYDREQKTKEADKCFARALELKPDDMDAKRAVAIACMDSSDYEEAKRLLSYMNKPGPYQEPALLCRLACGFQNKNQHGNALALFDIICRDFPEIAKKDKEFRKLVRQSEEAQNVMTTNLPPQGLSWGWIGAVLGVLLLAGITLGINHYLKTHQTLYAVNQLPVNATLSIPGVGDFQVNRKTVNQDITIPEGKYLVSVKIDGKVVEEVPIEIQNGILDRIQQDNAFIFNVCGAGVLLWEQVTYMVHPDPDMKNPYKLYVGDRFLNLGDIDYFFQEFPKTISLKNGKSTKKARVKVFGLPLDQQLQVLVSNRNSVKKIADFAEINIKMHPQNEALVNGYVSFCATNKLSDRAIEFFKQLVSERPVNIEMHRMYQFLQKRAGKNKELIKEYDQMLSADSGNSALLYLRGRITEDMTESMSFYDRSIKADPKNPYPWFAKGYSYYMIGDFENAKGFCKKGLELKPGSENMLDTYENIRFALGDYDELAKEAKQKLKKNKLDYNAFIILLRIRCIQNKDKEAKKLCKDFINEMKKKKVQSAALLESLINLCVNYIFQDFDQYLKIATSVKTLPLKGWIIANAYLAKEDFTSAEKEVANIKEPATKAYILLLCSLGWRYLKNNRLKADDAFDRAISNLKKCDHEQQKIASLLTQKNEKVIEKIDNMNLQPYQKTILFLALLKLYPEKRDLLLNKAEKMNFALQPPYYLLKSLINKMK